MEIDWSQFPIQDILRDNSIPFVVEHHNVSGRCILAVNCWACPGGDTGFHVGVFKEGGNFNCWKCGNTGSLYELMKNLVGMGWKEFCKLTSQPSHLRQSAESEVKKALEGKPREFKAAFGKLDIAYDFPDVAMPVDAIVEVGAMGYQTVEKFLASREFSVHDCCQYGAWACGPVGEYASRLLIPIYNSNKVVGFQARDMTGKAKKKYRNPPGFKTGEYLYEADRVPEQSTIVLLEGPFDVWRYNKVVPENGTYPVASFGTKLSPGQIKALIALRPKRLVFMWDALAYGDARDWAGRIGHLFEDIRVAQVPSLEEKDTDPDDYGKLYGGEAMSMLVQEAERL